MRRLAFRLAAAVTTVGAVTASLRITALVRAVVVVVVPARAENGVPSKTAPACVRSLHGARGGAGGAASA